MQQVLITLAAILSLGAGSVSACICSHHQLSAEIEKPSCHGHPETAEANAGQANTQVSGSEQCICQETAARASAKSDPLKFNKHIAEAQAAEIPQLSAIRVGDAYQPISFAKPSYLSDSFYNLAPKRGPPTF